MTEEEYKNIMQGSVGPVKPIKRQHVNENGEEVIDLYERESFIAGHREGKEKGRENGAKVGFRRGILLTTVTVLLVATLAQFMISSVNTIVDRNYARESVSTYSKVVRDNTRRTDDLQHYYYLIDNIGVELAEAEDYDKALYGIYAAIGYNQGNKKIQTDDVIASATDYANYTENEDCPRYTGFKDYLRKNGFYSDEDKDKDPYNQYCNAAGRWEKYMIASIANEKTYKKGTR